MPQWNPDNSALHALGFTIWEQSVVEKQRTNTPLPEEIKTTSNRHRSYPMPEKAQEMFTVKTCRVLMLKKRKHRSSTTIKYQNKMSPDVK